MKLRHIHEVDLEEGLKEKLAAGLAGAGITAGAMFGGNALMNKGPSPEQQTVQSMDVQDQEDEKVNATRGKGSDKLKATRDIQRKIIERSDGTLYLYYQSNSSKSPQIRLHNEKALQIKATHQFMQDTGSDMKGVQHGVSTKLGVSGAWFLIQ